MWYKIDCSHGPGHQGRDVWYIEADNRKEAISHAENDIDNTHWDWPIWTVRKVRKFPRVELERFIHRKMESLEDLEDEIKNTKGQLRELKSFRGERKGPKPEDISHVNCSRKKQKFSRVRGATSKCNVSKGEPGEKGWPYKKLFKGMCMDCPHGAIMMKRKKKARRA